MGDNRSYKKADWKKPVVKGLVSILLITASLLLLSAAEKSTAFAQWYSKYIYRGLVEIFGRIFSVFPFSVSEIGLYLLVMGLAAGLLVCLAKLIVRPKKLLTLAKAGSSFLLLVSVLLFSFTLGCGINYKKDAFSKQNSLFTFEYTKEELINLSRSLTADVNKWSAEVERNAGGITLEAPHLKQEAVTAMKNLSKTYEDLKGYYPIPKNLLFSDILSIQKTSGIYSPFTIEANYNNDIVPFNLPFTACHELSHLRGYMLEDEANFIAYLACMSSDSPYFKYSGSLMAWIYTTNVLYRADSAAYCELRASLLPEVETDLKANAAFWHQYDGQIAKTATKVNDTYLKANGQNDGVKSYNRMVDLLVAYDNVALANAD